MEDIVKYSILLAYLNAVFVVAYSSTSKTMNTLSTYDVNQAATVFLSNMIENANGRNMSAARNELFLLLPQQIQLVKALDDKTWEEAVEQRAIVCELDDEFYRDECNETFQEYSSALTDAEEIENRAHRYWGERNLLQTLLAIKMLDDALIDKIFEYCDMHPYELRP